MQCCSGHTEADIRQFVTQHLVDIAIGDASPLNSLFEEEFKGDTLSTRMKQIQQQRAEEEARRRRDKLKYEKKMEKERAKEREMFKNRMAAEEAKKAQRESERQEVKKIKERSEKTNENVEQSSENLGVTDKVNENITIPRHDADSNSSPEQTPQAVQDNKSSYYQHKSSIDINNEETASQGGSDIKKLALELDVDNFVAPQDEKDQTNLSNEPSFDSNSASGENLVSDSDEFKPNVMIKRQSKGM